LSGHLYLSIAIEPGFTVIKLLQDKGGLNGWLCGTPGTGGQQRGLSLILGGFFESATQRTEINRIKKR